MDTSFRDGHASLWAQGMRTGMMLSAAEAMNRAGFVAMEVIGTAHFKKCVRELREDPWERIRLLAARLTEVPLAAMNNSHPPETFGMAPRVLTRLWWERLAACGIRRVQLMEASNDIRGRLGFAVGSAKACGLQTVVALVYTLSPRHTDAYYEGKARDAARLGPDVLYIKDPGGLLTPERVRTLVPAVLRGAGGVPVEFHSHCTTGLAPLCYMEALQAGIDTVHTAVPPLANGASQPSVFNVMRNAAVVGRPCDLDEAALRAASERLTAIARREGLPLGVPLEYDHSQFVHQVPGGVISNLRHQLAQMGMGPRLAEVLEEAVAVRRELGYPIMVTPFSQFVVSQAAINVFLGERYREVTDELIRYALGFYGDEASGGVDPAVRARILDRPRARQFPAASMEEPSLEDVRRSLGGPGVSDEDLLLRYMVGDREEIDRMRAAGPPREYPAAGAPLIELLRCLTAGPVRPREVRVQKGRFLLVLRKGRGEGAESPPGSTA